MKIENLTYHKISQMAEKKAAISIWKLTERENFSKEYRKKVQRKLSEIDRNIHNTLFEAYFVQKIISEKEYDQIIEFWLRLSCVVDNNIKDKYYFNDENGNKYGLFKQYDLHDA